MSMGEFERGLFQPGLRLINYTDMWPGRRTHVKQIAFSIFLKICIHATAAKDRQFFKMSTDTLKGAWFTYSFKEGMRKDCSTSTDISVTVRRHEAKTLISSYLLDMYCFFMF